jgi:dynein heavy chain
VVKSVTVKQQLCDATAAEKTRLERETETTRARLLRAEKLTTGLVSEGIRWKQEVTNLTEQVHGLLCECTV